MKKKAYDHTFNLQERLKKGALLCACTIFWLLAGISNSNAATTPEQDSVKFSKQQMMIEQVFDAITKQLKYDVFYSENELEVKKMVQLPRLKMGLIEVLNLVLQKEFTYRFNGKTIIISPAKTTPDQQNPIRGIVKDENGEPLPGVTVLIKGTTTGVSTNAKGEFTIVSPEKPEATLLIFSFVGMETQQVTPKSDFVTVIMKTTLNELDEVIVRTGYENIDKRKLTSSVYTVKMDELMEPISNRLDQMLQGKIPGMAVLQMTSTVGAAPKIRIRGSSSILGSREPLWVLDGVVLEDPVQLDVTELNSMDKVNLIGNAISGLNPEDIEQIDVLKDASATALYGSKAANGVIMITTKRGKFGKPAIRYSTSMSLVNRPTPHLMHLMNSKDRVEVSEEIYAKGLYYGTDAVNNVGYEGLLRQLFANKLTYSDFQQEVKKMKEMNTNWYKLLFRNSFNHTHTLSVSGANESVNYYVSLGYSNMKGTTLQEESERYNFMTSFSVKISEKLNIGFSLNGSNSETHRPHSSVDLYQYAYFTSRAITPFNEDGTLKYVDMETAYNGNHNLVYNIFNELDNTGQTSNTLSFNSRMDFTYKPIENLSINGLASYNINTTDGEDYATEKSYYISKLRRWKYGIPLPTDDFNFYSNNCELPYGGILNNSNSKNTSYQGRLSISYNRTIHEDHSFSFMLGGEARSVTYSNKTSKLLGYLPERGKTHVDIDPAKWAAYRQRQLREAQPTVKDNKSNELSYFATFSYGYQNRYIINANMRGDASNKLGQDKSARFKPIWSFSGRWNIADEPFMKNVNWMEGLNIHASIGLQGNVTEAHNPNMIVNVGTLDEVSQQYISTLASLPNRKLRWEKTRSFNIGTDFSFFQNRLSATFEFYTKKGKDQLVSTVIESTNGATSVTINDGDLYNKGWELSITATPIRTKNFSWNLSFNTSKNYNKVKNSGNINDLVLENYLNGSLIQNGKSLNSFYSYRFGGLDKNGSPIFLGTQAKDEEGNILITNRQEAFEQGLVYSGKREPNFTGGLSTYIRYKNLSLNASLSMQFGSKIRLNDLYSNGLQTPMPSQNMSDEFVNRWREPGDEDHTNIPVLSNSSSPKGFFEEGSNNPVLGRNTNIMYNKSDLRVASGNFVRCRSLSLSYYLNSNILKYIYIKNASFSFSVSNPFTIKSKKLKGRDPEQVTLGSGSIPPQPTYGWNLSITF
ncbi:SusC/RagA family TonB-linked outer membrane protein [Butyricimonas hominis]|uniref:SusC/RagA family TonB-linked outer membrane protein n=1 Tax=Butyricimonas TaxID=574697 RepID=UPI003513315B